MTTSWGDYYQLSSPQGSIIPCDDELVINYRRPKCVLRDDNIHMFAVKNDKLRSEVRIKSCPPLHASCVPMINYLNAIPVNTLSASHFPSLCGSEPSISPHMRDRVVPLCGPAMDCPIVANGNQLFSIIEVKV